MEAVSNLDDFQAMDPFFRIIERGVDGLVDGEHFFDLLAEDVIVDYIITESGKNWGGLRCQGQWTRRVGELGVPASGPGDRSDLGETIQPSAR